MKIILPFIISIALVLSSPLAFAAPPQTINYQGLLTNATGTPVNGTLGMTFKFYNAESAGSLLHTESQPAVAVTNGNFNVLLGSPIPIPLSFDMPYWLTVTITGDPEMSPRQSLASSPYAFRAAALDGGATVAGLQISGTISSATLPATNLTGTIVTTQIANNAVTQAKLSPLTGAAAGKVLSTDGTNLQWQSVSAPGLTHVTPFRIPAGRTTTVNVIGEATAFDGSTTVNAGAGILAFGGTAISRGALRVDLSAGAGASLGSRNVSVSTGAQVLTLTNALIVIAPVTTALTTGGLSQGGSAIALVKIAPGQSFAPTIAGSTLVVGNATFAPSSGLTVVSNRWFGSDAAELVIEVSPFASLASAATLTVNYTGGGTDTASNFAPVDFTPVTPIAVGTPQAGGLFTPREAGLFSVAVSNAPVTLQFTVTPEPSGLLAPRVRFYQSGSPASIADVHAASGSVMIATNGTYVFSVVDRNGGGGIVGYGYTLALTP